MNMQPSEIAVIIAIYEPDEEALRAQLISLAGQEDVELRVLAVIADRRSGALVTGMTADCNLPIELVMPDAPSLRCDRAARRTR